MKNKLKKSVFLLSSLMMLTVGAGVISGISESPVEVAEAATYVSKSFGAGKLLITTTFNGTTYYLPATTTSSGPSAKSFTDVSTISEEHLWTITANGSNWYIQNSEGSYLYTTNTNNGVRVGSTANAWKYDSSANSFMDTATNRYLGIYNASNWRCYTTVNQANYKESSTSFVFYGIDSGAPSISVDGASYAQVEDVVTLEATLTNITGDVTWTSTNTDVATVNAGVVTAKAIGTTTIKADVNGTSGSKDFNVYPKDSSEISIADAIIVCELTGQTNSPYSYSVIGEIIKIDTPYDSGYGNISFTISDGTDSIKCYRVVGGSELTVGAEVKVTGKLVNYSGNTPEFIQGTTYEAVENGKLDTPVVSFDEENKLITWTSVESASGYTLYILDEEANEVVNTTLSSTSYDVSEFANGSYSVSVVAKGNASYEPSDEGYLEFTLAYSASEQVAAIETKTSFGFGYTETTIGESKTYSLAHTSSTTTNCKAGEDLYATFGLDETAGLHVYADKGSASNNIGLNKDGTTRLYYHASGSNILTIESDSKISMVTINYKSDTYKNGKIYTDSVSSIEGTADGLAVTYVINANKFYITNGNTENVQVHIVSMDIECGSAVTSYEFSDLRMRFAATISAEVYETLNITGAGFVVEVEGYSKTMEFDCTGKFTTDENGDYYILASLWQIPEEEYDTAITATAFIEVDGTRYFAQETSYSVNSIVDEYLSGDYLDANTKVLVQAFKDQELAA